MQTTTPPVRDLALDAARGVAVAAMVWVHFVPDQGPWTAVWAWDALPAVMFMMLVGVSAAARGARPTMSVLRRAASLALVGLVFWTWVWSNDILLPIACSLPVVAALRARPAATWCAIFGLAFAAPVAAALWGDYAWSEIRADGTHEANHALGWHTLRYFGLHGAYPLLPWLAFSLLGLRFAAARGCRRALLGWLLGGAAAAASGLAADRFGDAGSEGVAVHFDVTWQPTSLPFLLLWGGAASVTLSLVYLVGLRSRLLAEVGRWSLHHYLAHLTLVFWPMTRWWPDESWPFGVGVGAAAGYGVVAFALALRTQRGARS
jgi:uncharacterized membrane protein YeiB